MCIYLPDTDHRNEQSIMSLTPISVTFVPFISPSVVVVCQISVRHLSLTELEFNCYLHLAQRNICLLISNSCSVSQHSHSPVAYCGSGYQDESHQLAGSW